MEIWLKKFPADALDSSIPVHDTPGNTSLPLNLPRLAHPLDYGSVIPSEHALAERIR
jgi:hypothetical protein